MKVSRLRTFSFYPACTMATLHEVFTLCGLVSGPNCAEHSVQGIERGKDVDHVIVTDSGRSVTLYKVSDQKPLGRWTVKQGQTITCPAVSNTQTGEYVVVTDKKVIRVWKDEEINIDKAFKATVSADVERVHAAPDCEPVVLFDRGDVRLLDALLVSPQQPIDNVLSEEEVIRWSSVVVEGKRQVVVFTTEKKEDHFLYFQRFNPNSLQKYSLESEGAGCHPLSFSAAVRDGNVHLLYLYPNGCVYQSAVSVRGVAAGGVQFLPRTLLLRLPIGEGHLSAAAALFLDESHLAVVGAPHPSAGAGKDFLCIWNTNFQTLQAGKELVGRVHGQLWCYSGRLYVPHGKALVVVPYECQKSSLAAALGRLRQSQSEGSQPAAAPVLSWNPTNQEVSALPQRTLRGVETRKGKLSRKSQAVAVLTVEQVLERIKIAPEEDVEKEVEACLFGGAGPDVQLSVGQMAVQLVARCQSEPGFYPRRVLAQLVHTGSLCHSVCPDLLMLSLERKDYSLTQLCLQHFPDTPEDITCACLKAFLSVPDGDLDTASLEPDSMSFVEGLAAGSPRDGAPQNGFSPAPPEDQHCDAQLENELSWLERPCPVGLKKAALLNEVLQTAHTESFLLPPLKDLPAQHVVLFLRYLQFLYLKYSQNVSSPGPGPSGPRSPTMTQVLDWVCLLLDAHFTVLAMVPEAKDLLSHLHKFVRSQLRLFSELGKIQSSLQELRKVKQSEDAGLYSIEVIELL